MRRVMFIYQFVTLLKVLALVIISGLSILWLYQKQTLLYFVTLEALTQIVFYIAIIVVPMESIAVIVLYRYWKRVNKANFNGVTFPDATLRLFLLVFVLLWFLHSSVFNSGVVIELGLQQGTDEYMAWLRPGSRIIFLSVIGAEIIHATMRYLSKSLETG